VSSPPPPAKLTWHIERRNVEGQRLTLSVCIVSLDSPPSNTSAAGYVRMSDAVMTTYAYKGAHSIPQLANQRQSKDAYCNQT
jgi:hypothetical protein